MTNDAKLLIDLREYLSPENLSQTNNEKSHMNMMSKFVLDNAVNNNICSDISYVDILNQVTPISNPIILRNTFSNNITICCIFSEDNDENIFVDRVKSLVNEFQKNTCDETMLPIIVSTGYLKEFGTFSDNEKQQYFPKINMKGGSGLERHEIVQIEFTQIARNKTEKYMLDDPSLFSQIERTKKQKFIHIKFRTFHMSYEKSQKFIEYIHRPEESIYVFCHNLSIDIGCVFHKTEMEDYLTTQGYTSSKNSYRSMGKYCLSCEENSDGCFIPTKFKFFNKAINMWTVNSLTSNIGDKLHDWVVESETIQEINKSLEDGFSRIDVSFYGTQSLIQEKLSVIHKFRDIILSSKLLYRKTIASQWKNISDNFYDNSFLFDYVTGEYLLAQYCDVHLNRIMGSYGKLTDAQKINTSDFIEYTKKCFSLLGVKLHVFEFHPFVEDSNKMRIISSTWIKNNEESLLWKGSFNGINYKHNNIQSTQSAHNSIMIKNGTLIDWINYENITLTQTFNHFINSPSLEKTNRDAKLIKMFKSINYGSCLSLVNDLPTITQSITFNIKAIRLANYMNDKLYIMLDMNGNIYLSTNSLLNVIQEVTSCVDIICEKRIYYMKDLTPLFSFVVENPFQISNIHLKIGVTSIDDLVSTMACITFGDCVTLENGIYDIDCVIERKRGLNQKYILKSGLIYHKSLKSFDDAFAKVYNVNMLPLKLKVSSITSKKCIMEIV